MTLFVVIVVLVNKKVRVDEKVTVAEKKFVVVTNVNESTYPVTSVRMTVVEPIVNVDFNGY